MAAPITYTIQPPALPEPIVQPAPFADGRPGWRLHEPYRLELPSAFTCARSIEIPAGYQFDLASIPRFFWRIIAPHELSGVAPLVHDWLYDHHGRIPEHAAEPAALHAFTRSEADQLFRALMERQRVPTWRARLAFAAVRLFGRFAWPEPTTEPIA